MAKQIRGFWKRLCAIFATILGVGVVDKDANAADFIIPTNAIKRVTNCEYIVDRCEDGVHVGTLEGGAECSYHTYQATGETARLLATFANLRGKPYRYYEHGGASIELCGTYEYANNVDVSLRDPTSKTYGGVPIFCYDLWLMQNWQSLVETYGTSTDKQYLKGVTSCDSTEMTSDDGLVYNECSVTHRTVSLGRDFDNDVTSDIGYELPRYRLVHWYSSCSMALARLVGCADTSHVYARNGAPKYYRFDTAADYPSVMLEDVENGTHSCIDLGCGNFAGDTDVQNNYSLSQNACYANVADYADEYGAGDYYDATGTFEYVAYDADDNKCNCMSNGNVVCS